jgi:hypothetical protein
MSRQKTTLNTRQMARVVGGLIRKFAEQQDKGAVSVADFLRLLNVYKELDAQRGVKEVRVKWVGRDEAAG